MDMFSPTVCTCMVAISLPGHRMNLSSWWLRLNFISSFLVLHASHSTTQHRVWLFIHFLPSTAFRSPEALQILTRTEVKVSSTHVSNLSFPNERRRMISCSLELLTSYSLPKAGGRLKKGLEVWHLFTHLCRHKEQTNLGVFITEI